MSYRPREPFEQLPDVLTAVVDALEPVVGTFASNTETTEDGPDTPTAQPEPRRLEPPEEQVLDLVSSRGGRVWQQEIVAETGYSQGRISRLLTEMEDDEQVVRYWKRGQKVVAHPDAVHEALREAPET